MEQEKNLPSKALEGFYKVVGVEPGEVHTTLGTFDLRSITLKDAEKLFKAGFRYLEKIQPAAEKVVATKPEKVIS